MYVPFRRTKLFTNERNNLHNKCSSHVLLWNLMSKHEQPTMVHLLLLAVCLNQVHRVTDRLINLDLTSFQSLDDEVKYFIAPQDLNSSFYLSTSKWESSHLSSYHYCLIKCSLVFDVGWRSLMLHVSEQKLQQQNNKPVLRPPSGEETSSWHFANAHHLTSLLRSYACTSSLAG